MFFESLMSFQSFSFEQTSRLNRLFQVLEAGIRSGRFVFFPSKTVYYKIICLPCLMGHATIPAASRNTEEQGTCKKRLGPELPRLFTESRPG
mgnify:CR=1 FL=1